MINGALILRLINTLCPRFANMKNLERAIRYCRPVVIDARQYWIAL